MKNIKLEVSLIITACFYFVLPFLQTYFILSKPLVTQLTTIGLLILIIDTYKYYKDYTRYKLSKIMYSLFEWLLYALLLILICDLPFLIFITLLNFNSDDLDIISNFSVFWTLSFSLWIIIRKMQVSK